MDNGHTVVLEQSHANNSREAVVKLQERPFLVPSTMIPLVDLIIVIQRFYSKELGIKRRVTEISEVSRMDNKVLLGNIYDFDETLDQANALKSQAELWMCYQINYWCQKLI